MKYVVFFCLWANKCSSPYNDVLSDRNNIKWCFNEYEDIDTVERCTSSRFALTQQPVRLQSHEQWSSSASTPTTSTEVALKGWAAVQTKDHTLCAGAAVCTFDWMEPQQCEKVTLIKRCYRGGDPRTHSLRPHSALRGNAAARLQEQIRQSRKIHCFLHNNTCIICCLWHYNSVFITCKHIMCNFDPQLELTQ